MLIYSFLRTRRNESAKRDTKLLQRNYPRDKIRDYPLRGNMIGYIMYPFYKIFYSIIIAIALNSMATDTF